MFNCEASDPDLKRMIKFVTRWAFRLLLLLIVLGVALLLLKDQIIKSVAEARIRAETGMEARIGRLAVSFLSPVVTVQDFRLYNTAEFGGSPLVDLPELHLEMDRNALASRELHFRLVRLNLAEINVVQNKEGRSNLDRLQEMQKSKNTQAELTFTGIDTLNLTVGKLKFSDMKQPGQIREIHLGLQNEIVTNVHSVTDLTGVLVKIVLKNGGSLLGTEGINPGELLFRQGDKAAGKGAEKLLDGLTAPFRK